MADAFTRFVSLVGLKASWVDELPYFVWQVTSRESAAEFLRRYDAAASAAEPLHRVPQRFGSDQVGSLRPDMVAWVDHGQLSWRLRVELLSYQVAKVDDTWQETVHRDVATDSRTAPASAIPRLCAQVRRTQNLEVYRQLPRDEKAHLERCMLRWRAIGQLRGRPARQLTQRRKGMRAVAAIARVYRSGPPNMVSWTKLLHGESLPYFHRKLRTHGESPRACRPSTCQLAWAATRHAS